MQLLNLRKYGFLFVLLISGLLIISSCGDDEEPSECETTGLTYDNFAQDFLVTNCATLGGCHVEANKDELRVGSFESYSEAKMIVDTMNIIPAINHEDGVSNMPKGGTKLDDCSISKLTAWINAGAPE